jgi:hypothetical protein
MNPFPARRPLLRNALFALAVAVAAHAAAPAVPPAYPEAKPVLNGCHISTLAFLARYGAEFPGERGEAVRILMRNVEGLRVRHTIALFTWRGEWWCRDNILGVAALNRPAVAGTDLAALASEAEGVLDRIETRRNRSRRNRGTSDAATADLSASRRLREVEAAAALLPLASTVYWLRADGREIPVLFFRPGPGKIGVYEPSVGSCLAEIGETDARKIVALVGEQLGYRVAGVRADAAAERAPVLIASALR